MKQIKWIFLTYALLATASIMGIGIAIGERSLVGAIGSVLALILIMGMGFKKKRKMLENENYQKEA